MKLTRPMPTGYTGDILAAQRPKKIPTLLQLTRIAENYKSLRANVERVGELVLEMARHPDATDAEIIEVARGYRKHYASLRQVHKSCIEVGRKGPYTKRPQPWEKPL